MDNPNYIVEVKRRLEILARSLDEETERGMIVVGAAVLDDELKELLLAYIAFERNQRALGHDPAGYQKVKKLALRVGGPLHDLSAKNTLAYLLGLINHEYETIDVLARIRNQFAHKAFAEDYESPEVVDLIKNLVGKKKVSRSAIMEKIMTAARPIIARVVILRAPGLEADTTRSLLGLKSPDWFF